MVRSVTVKDSSDWPYWGTLVNYDLQLEYIVQYLTAVMRETADRNGLQEFKGLPCIRIEFTPINFEDECKEWYERSSSHVMLPEIDWSNVSQDYRSLGYVGAKDLIPGEVYYTGGCYRATYLYLGRDSDGMFCWYFVRNARMLRRNDLRIYIYIYAGY